ncbi:MAG TPA: hypothetical protein PKY35_06035 [Candidatus Hydrogenedentes bacterium]|nr:hypothetical protein [Candidatus Hydrogenedentota bacterium]HOL76571.1 hypothetical protein [Candidatus Hydrogenedentota bacterium]HPO85234.1 hypothetical protein [Candidatus Hydrogenedentota bacterium]
MVYFTCPKCQSTYQVKEMQLAEYFWCRKCRSAIKVSSNETDPPKPSTKNRNTDLYQISEPSSSSAALRDKMDTSPSQCEAPSREYDRDRDALLQLKQTLHETIQQVRAQSEAMAKLEQTLAQERKLRAELEKQLTAPSSGGLTANDIPQQSESIRSYADEPSGFPTVPEEQPNQEKLSDAAMIELLLRFSKK